MFSLYVSLFSSRNLLVRTLAYSVHLYFLYILLQSCFYFFAPLSSHSQFRSVSTRSEFVAPGKLIGPEDLVYDKDAQVLYATCADGWVKRLAVNESAADWNVQDWVNTGGRPLGIALRRDSGDVIVADAYKGLLRISSKGETEVLSEEADGVKFKLTDGVDVAMDGSIYFTDASSKYDVKESDVDILEGNANGRLMRFDPVTRKTQVIVSGLYFGNGVAVSPDQNSIVFCETSMFRCSRHFIQGEKKGKTEAFIENLPGLPDNIHHDGHGHYLIGLPTGMTLSNRIVLKIPLIRKIVALIVKHIVHVSNVQDAGVLVVDLEGRPVVHYSDPGFKLITSGILIGNNLYVGSLHYPHIIRLNISKDSWMAVS